MPTHPSVLALWTAYRAAPSGADASANPPPAWYFCDNAHDADECADLVVRGIKRATATSLAELEIQGDSISRVGDLNVVTDWSGVAQCIIRTTHVEVVPFGEVTAEFAAREGEGDGSLAYWRRVHRAYYERVLAETQRSVTDTLLIACESFEVVYPHRPTRLYAV